MSYGSDGLTGSKLYARSMAYYEANESDGGDLQHKVWDPTPWMLDVETGGVSEDRERAIKAWCYEKFGPQSWPIHNRPALWYQGSATVYGWCWFGFATEQMMREFQAKWGGTEDEPPSKIKGGA